MIRLLLLIFCNLTAGAIAAPPSTAASQPALAPLRNTLAQNYDDPYAHANLAHAFHDQGDLRTAFLICENARQLLGGDVFFPAFRQVFRGRSWPLAHATEEILKQAIRSDPKNVKPIRELAQMYASIERPDRAEHYYRRAYDLDRDDPGIARGFWESLDAIGRGDEGKTLRSQWCEAHPDSMTAVELRLREAVGANADSAAADLDAAVTKFPSSSVLRLLRGKHRQDEQHLDEAEADFVAAADLDRDSLEAQSTAAAFFQKTRGDETRALAYYYVVYFINPNFNDWVRVDKRIETTEQQQSADRIASRSIPDLLADGDPFVVCGAINRLAETWDDHAVDAVLKQIDSDAPAVRQSAVDLLGAHLTADLLPRIRALLKDGSPWIRSSAVTLISRIAKESSPPDLIPLLRDPAVLVRYTANTALLQDGGKAGRRAVLQNLSDERNDWIRQTVNAVLTQP